MKTKEKVILILSILVPFAVILLYVWMTVADVVFRDDMYLIKGGFVESYCNGTLTFADLWRAASSHRTLGYNMLQVANIKWFGMNSKIITLLIPFLILGSAIFIYLEYRNSLLSKRSGEFIAATFIFLGLIVFNLIRWEGLTFSYGIVYQTPMLFCIGSFICLELFLTKGEAKYWSAAFIVPALTVLVFGGTYSVSFALALGVTLILYILINRASVTKTFWLRLAIISIFLTILAFLYLYNIHDNDYFPGHFHHYVHEVFARPVEAIKFLLAAFGASVVGVSAVNIYFSFHSMVFLGSGVVFTYLLCGYLFFASKLYEKTYMPVYLLLQSFFYLTSMMLGRFSYGIDYGMASRYTCVSVYGLVGCVWIIIFFLVNSEDSKKRWHGMLYMPLVMIFSGMILTSIVEWRIQPHRRAYFRNVHEIALRVDKASDEELSKFEERPELVRQSLKVLRDCNLNIYRFST